MSHARHTLLWGFKPIPLSSQVPTSWIRKCWFQVSPEMFIPIQVWHGHSDTFTEVSWNHSTNLLLNNCQLCSKSLLFWKFLFSSQSEVKSILESALFQDICLNCCIKNVPFILTSVLDFSWKTSPPNDAAIDMLQCKSNGHMMSSHHHLIILENFIFHGLKVLQVPFDKLHVSLQTSKVECCKDVKFRQPTSSSKSTRWFQTSCTYRWWGPLCSFGPSK